MLLLALFLLVDGELDRVMMDGLVGDPRDALHELYEQHIHVLRLMNLVDVRLNSKIEKRANLSGTKAIIAHPRQGHHFDQTRES